MAFRIMTFNIKGAFFNDGENNWEHRYPLNLQRFAAKPRT